MDNYRVLKGDTRSLDYGTLGFEDSGFIRL